MAVALPVLSYAAIVRGLICKLQALIGRFCFAIAIKSVQSLMFASLFRSSACKRNILYIAVFVAD